MKVHPEELRLARAYNAGRAFEELRADQMHLIMERGRMLFKWYKAHPGIHNLINVSVLAFLLIADWWALLELPRLLLSTDQNPLARIVSAALAVGFIHGWLLYSVGTLSLHEGAAHNAVFSGTGPFGRIGCFIARNICRIAGAEPDQYAACHMAHHAKFGTEDDSEFLNFVFPRRYWLTFLPLATIINFTDFLAHRPMTFTRGRFISAGVAFVYNGAYAYLLFRRFGPAFALLTIFVCIHVGFWVDRLRQFTEHNLMPLDNRSGARSFGLGFWGLLLGGGPWGQPCHLVHHLVASIPWYQQLLLHRYMKTLLTRRQQQQFLLTPVIGFPKLLWEIIHTADTFAREQESVRTRV